MIMRALIGIMAAAGAVNAMFIMPDASNLAPHAHRLSAADLVRARLARPAVNSKVHGSTAKEAFARMNAHLEALEVATAPCLHMDLEELNAITDTLFKVAQAPLQVSYALRNDRRKLHFDSIDYKEKLWAQEREFVKSAATQAEIDSLKGGKCAENVMMFIHHLTESQRSTLAGVKGFVLSRMPADVSPAEARQSEYGRQIGCTSCHLPVHIPGKPDVSPIPNKTHVGPQFPEVCPIDKKTGLPTIWYNRTKRCDWDYIGGCKMCEGIGGIFWGNQEHEWTPMPCEPIASPEQVPVEQRMKPLWPKSFSVQEYAMLTFPGRDPCKVKFKNSTYTLHFKTTEHGPIYHTSGITGPSGPSPVPGSSWANPNGNFWSTIDIKGKPEYCICLGSVDPIVKNAFTGPLRYDFDVGAIYIGREKIRPEYLNKDYIADHYVKGPHHFWYDITTGFMIREMQPFNGLNVYHDWDLTPPSDEMMTIPKICRQGIQHFNVSCKYPEPSH